MPLRQTIIAPEHTDFCLFRNNETKKMITLPKRIGSKRCVAERGAVLRLMSIADSGTKMKKHPKT